MLAEDVPCEDILTQLNAVNGALHRISFMILDGHLRHCVREGLEKGNGVGWTIFPKALTPRVRNERDFDTSADIFSMWASRMEEAAQWKHHAQLGLEMRGIFGRACRNPPASPESHGRWPTS